MGEIFIELLNRSINAGWLILAAVCFRIVFRRAPKWVNCLLWGLVAVRLVCPFSIESQFSLLADAEPVKLYTLMEGGAQESMPSVDGSVPAAGNIANRANSGNPMSSGNPANPMSPESFSHGANEGMTLLQAVPSIAGVVWALGMILLTIGAFSSLWRLRRLVGEAVCLQGNQYLCDAAKSPFILGLVRPRIFLPSGLEGSELEYIMAHEVAHLKRKDHWWKALGYILLCVYWFHPLCWLAYILLCRDIEMACDEKVVKGMSFHDKKEYSKTLLSAAGQRRLVTVCPLAFGEVGVRQRVKSVLQYKKPAFWIVLVSIAACLILAVCFLTIRPREYQIRVTIPAGGTGTFYYSDEEICPRGNRLILYAGEGLGDGEIELKPVEVRQENAYDESSYITPGMPVKMEVEKGAWFRIGINTQNLSQEDIDVYVSVRNVDVRIASTAGGPESGQPVVPSVEQVDLPMPEG